MLVKSCGPLTMLVVCVRSLKDCLQMLLLFYGAMNMALVNFREKTSSCLSGKTSLLTCFLEWCY